MEDTVEASFQQSDLSTRSAQTPTLSSAIACGPLERSPWLLTRPTQVLLLTMGLSFGINDYIEGGVITAVILLNIVVG